MTTSSDSYIQGLMLTSNSGPGCHIEEIDDFKNTNVGMLKDVLKDGLGLSDWVMRQHI